MIYSTPSAPFIHEPDEAYFASGAWGSTDAKRMLISPRLARDHRDGIVEQPDSKAFSVGRCWDAMLSCGHQVADVAAVRPADLDARTTAGKQWLAEAKASGREILTADEGASLQRMLDRMPPDLRDLALRLPSQLVIRRQEDGWASQGKLDAWDEEAWIMYDFKTTSKPLEDWPRSAYGFGYHFQSGWYRRVLVPSMMGCFSGIPEMHFLVTETIAPWRTALFVPEESWVNHGDDEAYRAAKLISQCIESGDWSDQAKPTRTLSLPGWVRVDS